MNLKNYAPKPRYTKDDLFDSESIMPFGQHEGKKLCDIPTSYLVWLYENKRVKYNLAVLIKKNIETLRNGQKLGQK